MLNKVNVSSHKRKLDTSVHKNVQRGSDPMDMAAVQHDWHYGEREGDVDAVGFYGCAGTSKGKSNGKDSCLNCKSNDHFARKCPYQAGR